MNSVRNTRIFHALHHVELDSETMQVMKFISQIKTFSLHKDARYEFRKEKMLVEILLHQFNLLTTKLRYLDATCNNCRDFTAR